MRANRHQAKPNSSTIVSKKNGFKHLKSGQIPAKANPDEQQLFLEEKLKPVLKEAQENKRHVFFMDASHFVMGAYLGYLWCLVRVFIKTPSGRQRFNVLGALHAITLQVVTFTNDQYINSFSVVELLKKLAMEFTDLPITIVLDNAKYQRNKFVMGEATKLGIELLFLPTYSPNLNLIERLWKNVKSECLYSKHYENFTDFKASINSNLSNSTVEHKKTLSTLLTLNFQMFKNVA